VVGSKVWLEGANLKLTHPKAKLDAKRYGPFLITKAISPVVFQLALPPQWRIHDVFHASLLTPYKETEEYGENFMQPPPELIEGQEEYVSQSGHHVDIQWQSRNAGVEKSNRTSKSQPTTSRARGHLWQYSLQRSFRDSKVT
jgi:hypothetical protein